MADCVTCGTLLVGRQRKYCADSECSKSAGREAHLLSVYGIDRAEWEVIWKYQGECCGICKRKPKVKPDGTVEVFHTDHEHAVKQSGPIRGILCPFVIPGWSDASRVTRGLSSLPTIFVTHQPAGHLGGPS